VNSARKKISELISPEGVFTDGDWVESKDQDPNGGVRLIQLADIGVGKFINKSSRFMTEEKISELNCTPLEKGDILVARMPDPIGRACIFPGLDQPAVTVVDVCVIRPCSDEIDSRWLMRLINSQGFHQQILQYVTGTTRQRISRGNLAKLEVFVPPLEEQKRIASILDKADAIRRKRQQAIELADQFLRSVFLDMFGDPVTNPKGWEMEDLKNIAEIQIGPFGTQLHKEDYIEGGIPLINPSHIINGKIAPKYDLSISPSKHVSLPEYHLQIDDIIMGRRGEMGRCAIVSSNEEGWMCGTGSLIIRPSEKGAFAEYLNTLLKSATIKRHLEEESLGATLPNLNKTIVGAIRIPVPNAMALRKYDVLKAKFSSTKEQLKSAASTELFEALSQSAFNGELTQNKAA
jgi:type I restriction enzyme, S subunit